MSEIKRLTDRAKQLIKKRDPHISKWKELRDWLAPDDGLFSDDELHLGSARAAKGLNPRPIRSVGIAQAGMTSGMASEARDWFHIKMPNGAPVSGNVRNWLYEVKQSAKGVLSQSNFYGVLNQALGTELVFGTCAVFADRDLDDLIRFVPVPIGSFCLDCDAKGRVDTFYREFRLTPRQMVAEFGDKVSANVKAAADNGDDKERIICHLIEPNPSRKSGKGDKSSKRFRSTYWEKTEEGILRQGGYSRFPVLCPRWRATTHSPYGVGIGDQAIRKVKELDLLEADKLRLVQQIARPTMAMPVSTQGLGNRFLPSATVYVPDNLVGTLARPVYEPNHGAVAEIEKLIAREERAIGELFFEDIFLMISQSDGNMTAYEVGQRKEEKMQMLGPVADRNNEELFDPLMDILFELMLDQSMPVWLGYSDEEPLIPVPPNEIAEIELSIEYVSVLSQAQKAQSVGSIERSLQFAGMMAQAGFAQAMDNIDPDGAISAYNEAIGAPAQMLNNSDRVEQIRRARAEEAMRQEEWEKGAALLEGVKTMSETQTTGDSLLAGLIGGGVA